MPTLSWAPAVWRVAPAVDLARVRKLLDDLAHLSPAQVWMVELS